MIYSPQFKVILDANVLYPAPIRDLLLNIADLNLIAPKWTELIQDEWVRNLIKNRPDLSAKNLNRTIKIMNQVFPDAEIYDFEDLIDNLELPDENDRHVLAAGIKSNADAIITFNKKDFPKKYIKDFEIDILTPNELLILLNKFSPELVNQAFTNQLNSLKNPPVTKKQLIGTLAKIGIKSIGTIVK